MFPCHMDDATVGVLNALRATLSDSIGSALADPPVLKCNALLHQLIQQPRLARDPARDMATDIGPGASPYTAFPATERLDWDCLYGPIVEPLTVSSLVQL